jgi:hypothetical protein
MLAAAAVLSAGQQRALPAALGAGLRAWARARGAAPLPAASAARGAAASALDPQPSDGGAGDGVGEVMEIPGGR